MGMKEEKKGVFIYTRLFFDRLSTTSHRVSKQDVQQHEGGPKKKKRIDGAAEREIGVKIESSSFFFSQYR